MTTSDRTPPYSRDALHDVVFGQGLAKPSLAEYFDEVSAGRGHSSYIPAVRIDGEVLPWVTIAPGFDIDSLDAWLAATGSSYETGADIYFYVFNTPAENGGGFSHPRAMIGARGIEIAAGSQYGVIAHEILHRWNVAHDPSVRCASSQIPFPLTTSALVANCTVANYGNLSSVMSGSKGGAHLSGYYKSSIGFLQGSVTWVNASDEPEAGAMPLAPGTSVTLDLFDSVSQNGSSARQLIVLKLEADDTSYMIDYRRAIGTNRYAGTGSTGQIPFPQGVYAQLKPGHDVGFNGARTLQPVLTNGMPLIATTGTPYVDADRGIRITVVEDRGYMVRVRIDRDAADSTPLIGCATNGCGTGSHATCRTDGVQGYCDSLCTGYGDCCDDYASVCLP